MSASTDATWFDALPKTDQGLLITQWVRDCSHHEAGHAVAALALGVPWVRGRVYRCDQITEFAQRAIGGDVRYSHATTKLTSAIIGYAGVVAELLQMYPDADIWTITEEIEIGVTSPSDGDWLGIREIHTTWQKRALAKCIDLIKANWSKVEAVAKSLVADYEWHREAGTNRESDGNYLFLCASSVEHMEAGK